MEKLFRGILHSICLRNTRFNMCCPDIFFIHYPDLFNRFSAFFQVLQSVVVMRPRIHLRKGLKMWINERIKWMPGTFVWRWAVSCSKGMNLFGFMLGGNSSFSPQTNKVVFQKNKIKFRSIESTNHYLNCTLKLFQLAFFLLTCPVLQLNKHIRADRLVLDRFLCYSGELWIFEHTRCIFV